MFSTQHRTISKSEPQVVALSAYPPAMEKCFQFMRAAGAEYFALFGGAVRNAD